MFEHHAYYIEDSLSLFDEYKNVLAKEGSFGEHDANYSARSYVSFGVDDAREHSNLATLKHHGAQQLFFIAAASMTSEAQQALLKLFEEPKLGVVFMLLVPHGILLPTLRSRMLALSREELLKKIVWKPTALERRGGPRTFSEEVLPGSGEAKEFLGWPYKKRSDWIAEFLEDDDEISPDKQTRERVRTFVNNLERELHPRISDAAVRAGLEDIAHFRQYLSDRSPSLKMLLEHLAASLPTIR
jgi:hypothetical protein